jgi:hypothetical protein
MNYIAKTKSIQNRNYGISSAHIIFDANYTLFLFHKLTGHNG